MNERSIANKAIGWLPRRFYPRPGAQHNCVGFERDIDWGAPRTTDPCHSMQATSAQFDPTGVSIQRLCIITIYDRRNRNAYSIICRWAMPNTTCCLKKNEQSSTPPPKVMDWPETLDQHPAVPQNFIAWKMKKSGIGVPCRAFHPSDPTALLSSRVQLSCLLGSYDRIRAADNCTGRNTDHCRSGHPNFCFDDSTNSGYTVGSACHAASISGSFDLYPCTASDIVWTDQERVEYETIPQTNCIIYWNLITSRRLIAKLFDITQLQVVMLQFLPNTSYRVILTRLIQLTRRNWSIYSMKIIFYSHQVPSQTVDDPVFPLTWRSAN